LLFILIDQRSFGGVKLVCLKKVENIKESMWYLK